MKVVNRPKTHEVVRAPRFEDYKPSSEEASASLSRIRSVDTRAEVLLRSALWRRGLRFRKNSRALPGKPDIVFPTEHVVVFCDGDFWHGRNWSADRRRLAKGPNATYWLAKVSTNKRRDRAQSRWLEKLGWTVMRFWDSDVRSFPESIADQVEMAVRRARRTQCADDITRSNREAQPAAGLDS
jgi:DNA mismatch endonuclease (patch repair protein)